ncbi:MAG: hypothetical protein LBK29_04710 [Oscillospiraceae bacterium]|jgi:hypothetical protein|nr:hypothetical protein [Oscillospiraceae bacterium]
MCCSSCCYRPVENNSINGTFTQNIPVTLSYSLSPVSIGNSGVSPLYGNSGVSPLLSGLDSFGGAGISDYYANTGASALSGLPTRRRSCCSCCSE